jgi:uncharacterized membrane protein
MPELRSIPGGAADPGPVRDHDKPMLVLSYLGALALIPLLTVHDSEYVKWHARQGLTLAGCWLAFTLVELVVALIPVLGFVLVLLGLLVHAGLFFVSIFCIVKAMNGERWKVPFIGDLAERF